MVRLDKFLCDTMAISRKQAMYVLRSGKVTVDGEVIKSGAIKVSDTATICCEEKVLTRTGPRYFMMNKPIGTVCSHEDPCHATVFSLLDEIGAEKMHLAGRLDVDTTGLLLFTDDGQWSHRVTSPKHKCDKAYYAWLADPLDDAVIAEFADGVMLRGEKQLTLPAKLEILQEREARVHIHEGKYHQVKRMFAAVGNKVVGLHRESVGALMLDASLAPGEYRPLSAQEIALFQSR